MGESQAKSEHASGLYLKVYRRMDSCVVLRLSFLAWDGSPTYFGPVPARSVYCRTAEEVLCCHQMSQNTLASNSVATLLST